MNHHRLDSDTRVYDENNNEATCMWFALCDNPANGLRKGPTGNGDFGEMPICQRCDDKIRG